MQIQLSLPHGWPVVKLDRQQLVLVPGTSPNATDLFLASGWLVPLPDNEQSWYEQALRVDMAPSVKLTIVSTTRDKTQSGWPMTVVEARASVNEGLVAEYRMAAFYTFFEYGAVVLVRGKIAERYDTYRDTLIEIMKTGAPSWQAEGEIVALADLYHPLENKPASS
jgi:hypothetical protein